MHSQPPDPEASAREALGNRAITAPYLSPRQLADLLDVPLGTVYGWSTTETGPRRIRIGKHVRYRRDDVEAWLVANSTGSAA